MDFARHTRKLHSHLAIELPRQLIESDPNRLASVAKVVDYRLSSLDKGLCQSGVNRLQLCLNLILKRLQLVYGSSGIAPVNRGNGCGQSCGQRLTARNV